MSAGVKKSFTCCAQRPKLTQRGFPVGFLGYRQSMSPLEQFIDEVEVSISDAVDALDPEATARLYAEVLDLEQRLDALSDVLTVLASSRS
jgi:hypothetical protein